jgi:hypothetical protein
MSNTTLFKAFPLGNQVSAWQNGMDLRDYFAAHAPVDFVDLDCYFGVNWESTHGKELAMYLAKARYEYADAMMEARYDTK